jgi:DNA-formamidopyrimidine glycosylase
MPEGPEVTTIARQLNGVVQNKTIEDIEILSGRYTKKEPDGFVDFRDWAVNYDPQTVLGISNKGKFIYWVMNSGVIFSGLGMTGTYKTQANKYARVRWLFTDQSEIYYCDMRNFGTLKFFSRALFMEALNRKLAEIGPDMLNAPCSIEEWLKICYKRSKDTLVKFLMEQKNVSGVGNIYKSESLFLARLHPAKTIQECSERELRQLYHAVCKVLQNSFETGGATIKNYSDLYNNQGKYVAFPSQAKDMTKARTGIMVYSQSEDPYGNPVKKLHLNDNRTTYFSPEVQI